MSFRATSVRLLCNTAAFHVHSHIEPIDCKPSSAFLFLPQLVIWDSYMSIWVIWERHWWKWWVTCSCRLCALSTSCAQFWMYHFHFFQRLHWAHPTLSLCGSDRTYLTMGNSGCMVTWFHMVKHSVFTEPSSTPGAYFKKLCNYLQWMTCPCSFLLWLGLAMNFTSHHFQSAISPTVYSISDHIAQVEALFAPQLGRAALLW